MKEIRNDNVILKVPTKKTEPHASRCLASSILSHRDEFDREPIGRPWLTLVIDVATRMVPGFHLTLEAPSATSVALALLPEHRPEAMRSNEERIRSIRVDRWIGSARADAILVRMRELVTYPPHDRMPALLLYGATGMGKTKILRKFLRDHPPSFDNRAGITRMQLVSMQMPPEPDERSFWSELLDALDSPMNNGHTSLQMRRTARDLLRFVDAKVLIVDELHALLAGTHRQQEILLNALRLLASDLKLPLILAGTTDAKRALMTDRQLADRFEAMELPPWHNDDSYARLLASFLCVLPLRRRSELVVPAVRKALLEHTQGITVRIVRAIENLAVDAIRSGRECIDQQGLSALALFPPLLSMEDRSSALA